MELGFARWEDLPQLREIWRSCFGGPEQYLDFYYERRFSPRDTLVARDGGRPVAMLTLMNVRLNGEKGGYIYAVGTLPSHRGRGLQRQLCAFSLEEMARRGFAFSCLVPAESSLFSWYQKLGYQTDFYRWEKRITAAGTPADFVPIPLGRCGYSRFAALRRGYLQKLKNPLVHPDRELRYIYQELCSFQGSVAVFIEEGRPCYAAYSAYDGRIYLREQSGGDPERVTRSLMALYGFSEGLCTSGQPFPGAVRTPYGMGRLIEGEGALSDRLAGSGYMALMLD